MSDIAVILGFFACYVFCQIVVFWAGNVTATTSGPLWFFPAVGAFFSGLAGLMMLAAGAA